MERRNAAKITSQSRPAHLRMWRRRPIIVIVGCVALLPLIVYLDVITGAEFSLAYCYVIPVLIATWFAGRWAGFIMAGATVTAWIFAEKLEGIHYTKSAVAYWNFGWRLVFLVLAAAQLWAFRNLKDRLEAMVEARTDALHRLAIQLLESENRERQRLAYDIHDDFGQVLTTLKLNLSTALPESSDGSLAKHRKEDAIAMVDDLIARSRTLIFDLHPAMLDQFGLAPTLRRHAEQFGKRANVEVLVLEEGTPRQLTGQAADFLFRSIKELLNNAVKHGRAKQIITRIIWESDGIRIVVDDDGEGFDTAELLAPNIQRGLGLVGIRERLTSLGGSLRLESTRGQGTRVMLEMPMDAQETPV